MTYTPTQIEIIKRFGKKELTDGCLIQEGRRLIKIVYETGIKNSPYFCIDLTETQFSPQCGYNPRDYEDAEILGHIPHLEDVFRVTEDNGIKCSIEISMYTEKLKLFLDDNSIEYNPTIPLLNQEESTLQELLSLFPN